MIACINKLPTFPSAVGSWTLAIYCILNTNNSTQRSANASINVPRCLAALQPFISAKIPNANCLAYTICLLVEIILLQQQKKTNTLTFVFCSQLKAQSKNTDSHFRKSPFSPFNFFLRIFY